MLTGVLKWASTRAMRTEVLEGAAEVADFDAVVRQYRPRIFRFALASLRDRDAAETVTQDCFLRAHAAWEQFRGDSSVQTWLMQIAVNLIRDTGRNRRFQFWRRAFTGAMDLGTASDWLRDSGASPEQQLAARQRVNEVWSVVGKLSERQRTVFLLTFMEEMSPAEIEAATGITRAAIKVHLFRAVHTIRERLGDSR
jgi:RNA polymerase sigma-70 factor (ECF subfamily)